MRVLVANVGRFFAAELTQVLGQRLTLLREEHVRTSVKVGKPLEPRRR